MNNKLLSILLFLLILILILMLVAIKVLIFPSYKVNKYGNRLDGIEDIKLTETRVNEVKDKFETVDGFTIDKFRLSGKIVNIYIKVNGDISVDKVKSSSMKLVSSFSEEELKFYDFQVFVTGPDDNKNYPMIGYKNKNSEGMDWNYEGGN
jgi:hypothetical protein